MHQRLLANEAHTNIRQISTQFKGKHHLLCKHSFRMVPLALSYPAIFLFVVVLFSILAPDSRLWPEQRGRRGYQNCREMTAGVCPVRVTAFSVYVLGSE